MHAHTNVCTHAKTHAHTEYRQGSTGQDSAGQPLANGLYSFSVESFAAGKLLKAQPAQVYTSVTEIQNQNGSISVVLAGGTKVAASEVSALRNP